MRKMRQDEGENFSMDAGQWQCSIRKKVLPLDDLIKFLDRSKVETELTTTLYTIWTNSEAFKATHHLIRTVKEFDSVFLSTPDYYY
jgi:predicted restriction endonuclease